MIFSSLTVTYYRVLTLISVFGKVFPTVLVAEHAALDPGRSKSNLIIFLPILLSWRDGELSWLSVAQSVSEIRAGL